MRWSARLKTIILCISVLSLLCAPVFAASIPQLINYNGTLTDTGGTPVPDGNYDVTFKIYDASTGGTVLWTEIWNASTSQVIVNGGNFNAMLGAHVPIPTSFFSDNPTTFLGVTVGTDSEMMPRQKITSVGYAFAAENGVPKGGIVMWSGAVNQIPGGWTLCDGTNGTPDLRNRFIVGAGSGYSVNQTGGEATHVLTVSEIPSHNHSVDPPNTTSSSNGAHTHTVQLQGDGDNGAGAYTAESNDSSLSSLYTTASNGSHNHTTDIAAFSSANTGGGSPHNNLPPYYALAYIMKL